MIRARSFRVAVATLALGVACAAQVTEARPRGATPAQRFEALLAPYRSAEALVARLHFRGAASDEEGAARLVADVAMHVRFALPAHGSLEMRGQAVQDDGSEMSPFEQDLVGTGTGLHHVDHRARTVRAVGSNLTEAYELWIDLVPFRAFARQELAPWRRVFALDSDPERPHDVGYSLRYPYYRVDYWFDREGLLRRGRLSPETEFLRMVPTMEFEVSEMRLHASADELAFTPSLPADYEQVDATP